MEGLIVLQDSAQRSFWIFITRAERIGFCLLPPPPRSCSHHVWVGLGSEVKGRDMGLSRQHVTEAAYRCSTVPTTQVCGLGSTPRRNPDPEPDAEKDKARSLVADRVASGNEPGKEVNAPWYWDRVFGGLGENWACQERPGLLASTCAE